MLEINILGCGSSCGVPVIGCSCSVCKSDSAYNKRLRSSILINQNKTKILVDFGFNVKEQLLAADVYHLDAAILTHDHADHVSGIDELRIFYYIHGKPLDIYVSESIAPQILARYNYLFNDGRLKMHAVGELEQIVINDVKLQLFPQIHGPVRSLGVRVDNFVYSCDTSGILPESESYLENMDVWVVDCMDYKSTFAHAGLESVLKWDEKYKPKKIYLTNMNHNINYHEILKELPRHVVPCYDGLAIKL